MEKIYIHKGDSTTFADCKKFLTFQIETGLDLTGWKAEFILGYIVKRIEDISSKSFEVILSAKETNQLRYGEQNASIVLVDSEGNVKTIVNTILFEITSKVIENSYQLVDLSIPESSGVDIKLKVGAEYVTSINGMAGDVILDIPTRVSDLENDRGFLTKVPAEYITETELNAKGYLTEHQDISGLASDEELQGVKSLIPTTANLNNKLADQGFVNSSIQTSTAHFRGDWATWADVPTDSTLYPVDAYNNHAPTPNDYLVIIADETQNGGTWRYKYTGLWSEQGKDGWKAEYQINETPLTAEQLAALNSGITAELMTEYVKNTDYATTDKGGVVKQYRPNSFTSSNGLPICTTQTLDYYNSRTDGNMFIGRGTLENIKDDYVKRGLTENTIELTDDEKISARTWLGAISNTDYAGATSGAAGVVKCSSTFACGCTNGYIQAMNIPTLERYNNLSQYAFIGKATLETALTQYSKTVLTTQADYDALETKDENTLYLIEE